jgi:acyl-CoA thioester hydrolase
MEAARGALFARFDLDVPQIQALGFRMYVVDARCRYLRPLVYGDVVLVSAWFRAVAPLIRVGYDLHHAASRRWCARATTVLATTDAGGAVLTMTPHAILQRLPASHR